MIFYFTFQLNIRLLRYVTSPESKSNVHNAHDGATFVINNVCFSVFLRPITQSLTRILWFRFSFFFFTIKQSHTNRHTCSQSTKSRFSHAPAKTFIEREAPRTIHPPPVLIKGDKAFNVSS